MVEQWLRGRPQGTTLEVVVTEARLAKNQTVLDAIAGERAKVKELVAKRDDIARRPYPREDCKKRVREIVGAAAARGTIDVAPLVKYFRDFAFPTRLMRVDIIGGIDRPAVGLAHDTQDSVALVAWLFKDALIKKLDAAIDACDATGAQSHEARERAESELGVALLEVERRECALVRSAKADNLPAEFRHDCSPLAILGCRMIALPPKSGGTSPGHVISELVFDKDPIKLRACGLSLMDIFRILLTLYFVLCAVGCTMQVVSALRTGRFDYRGFVFRRKQRPIVYWINVVLGSCPALAFGFLAAWLFKLGITNT